MGGGDRRRRRSHAPPTTPTPATQILDTEGVAPRCSSPTPTCSAPAGWRRHRSAPGLAAGSQSDPADAVAGCRAHNRWLADFVGEEPHRRIGIAVIPAIIPDMDVVLELVREAKDLGHRGVLIPTRWFDRPAYHDPHYDPLFALVEELGLVLHTHSGAGPADYGMGYGMLPIYASEAGWWAARPLHVLIWAGVFERYPTLQVLDGRERRLVGARPDPQDGREVGRRAQHPQVRRRLPPGACR